VPLGQLVRAQDRLTFIYLEHCVVHRDANAITARDARGTVHIPAAALGAVLLGPGTTVSQQAIALLAESGSTAVWVGEQGVRYYAHGRSLARSSRLLETQRPRWCPTSAPACASHGKCMPCGSRTRTRPV
jgi:CRISPR-associated protein Cas1